MLSMLKHQKWHFFFNFALWWRITIGFKPHKLFFPTKDDGLSHPKLEAVAKMYNMDNVSNVEVVTKKCWWGWITQNQYCNKIMLRWSSSGSDLVWRRSGRMRWSRPCVSRLCRWWMGGWLILDLLLVSKASLNLKMIIFREGLSLSNLCIAISMLGRRKGHRHFQSSQVCWQKMANGLNTGL